ncbi:MAG: glycoside hydrolase family 3 C-terminal domain-containing protein [Bacilli bacterium]
MEKKKLLKTALFVSSLLLGASIVATEMTFTWQIAINRYISGNNTSGVNNGVYQSDYSTAGDLVKAKRKLISDIAAEGSTLLKNDNTVLPLAKNSKVSLFSHNSIKPVFGSSSGGGKVTCPYTLQEVMESDGLKVNPTLWDFYNNVKGNNRSSSSTGYKTGEVDPSTFTDAVKNSYKEYSDAALVLITRTFGEGTDASKDPSWVTDGDGKHNVLELQDTERKVIEEAKKCSNKVIVVINSDFAMDIDELKHDDKVNSIIWTGSLGNSGIYGLSDVISGNVSPSGHLPDTYSANVYNAAAVNNFGDFTYANANEITAASASKYVVYQEGIYVGYRYFETRYEDTVLEQGNASKPNGASDGRSEWKYDNEVSYSFGYGLSYTDFDRKINSIDWNETTNNVKLNVTTKNIGDVASKDVLQAYVNSPYTDYDKTNKVEKSSVALAGFEKTALLKPGDEATIDINIDLHMVASYDYTKAKTFILDYGDYYFGVGNGAHDALNNILAAKGKTTANGMDYDGDRDQAIVYNKSGTGDVDASTCSTSKYSGKKITNQLEKADLQYYGEDLVTYLSRSDWEKTWSDGVVLTANDKIKSNLANGSTYTKTEASNDLSSVVSGKDYASKATSIELSEMNGLDYDDPKWTDLLSQLTLEEMSRLVGLANSGVIESINMPAYMAFDGPSGICSSYITDEEEYTIYASMFTSEGLLSATFNKELALEEGKMFGNDGLWTGFHCVWGPGNNTHRTPYLGRNGEYYSEDSTLAYYMTQNEVAGAYEYGVSLGPKHIAFNDQETNRGGVSTYVNEQAAREIYLRAFEGALASGKANCTMCAKNRLGAEYIGAVSGLMKDILVGEWNYHGVVIADSASDGYVNGPTSLINGTTEFDTNTTEFVTGSLSPDNLSSDAVLFKAVKEACHRNLYLWANTWLTAEVKQGEKVSSALPWYQVTSVSLLGGFGAIWLITSALTAIDLIKSKKEEKI